MTTKREGPFEITEVLGPNTFRLNLPPTWRIHDVFHATLLSPYVETETHGPNYTLPSPELIDGEEEYEIDKILKHRVVRNQRQFLVSWKGYPLSEAEWKKEKELSHAKELLKAYKRKHKLT